MTGATAFPQSTAAAEVYTGFWLRAWASIIDGILVVMITYPILWGVYGNEYFESEAMVQGPLDFLLSWILPMVGTILFWIYKAATPGKMAIGARIADAESGNRPSVGQCVGRYFGYIISALPLGLGFLWVAFDPKKQGFHDKLAGTVVIRRKPQITEVFEPNRRLG